LSQGWKNLGEVGTLVTIALHLLDKQMQGHWPTLRKKFRNDGESGCACFSS